MNLEDFCSAPELALDCCAVTVIAAGTWRVQLYDEMRSPQDYDVCDNFKPVDPCEFKAQQVHASCDTLTC
jgi:hypothetical protein